MKYVLDANVFISGAQRHYKFQFMPGFWDWVLQKHSFETLCSFKPVQDELLNYGDALSDWVKVNQDLFLPPSQMIQGSLEKLSHWTASSDRTARAKNNFLDSVDYQIIAFAHSENLTVVTEERPEPLAKGKIKIPDACEALGVNWISPWDMLEAEGARFVLS